MPPGDRTSASSATNIELQDHNEAPAPDVVAGTPGNILSMKVLKILPITLGQGSLAVNLFKELEKAMTVLPHLHAQQLRGPNASASGTAKSRSRKPAATTSMTIMVRKFKVDMS